LFNISFLGPYKSESSSSFAVGSYDESEFVPSFPYDIFAALLSVLFHSHFALSNEMERERERES
jgi:hypothetical protein